MKKTTDRNCKLLEKETLKVIKELLLQLQKNIKSRESWLCCSISLNNWILRTHLLHSQRFLSRSLTYNPYLSAFRFQIRKQIEISLD